MSEVNRPLLNTHFRVDFQNHEFINDINFHSVEGLSVRLLTEDDVNYTSLHFENLILRRAFQANSALLKWCMDSINSGISKPVDIFVTLLNEMHHPICVWTIIGAFPVAWRIDEMHAQEPKILMERIELKYDHFYVLDQHE